MPRPASTLVAISFLTLCIGACASDGDWPKLSDPLPRAEDRIREILPIPAPAPAPDALEATTTGNPGVILDRVRQNVQNASSAYEKAVNEMAAPSQAEEQAIAWRAAQMALTRVTMALSPVLNSGDAASRAYVSEIQAWAKTERRRLADLAPQP